jgi:hypothetical protein
MTWYNHAVARPPARARTLLVACAWLVLAFVQVAAFSASAVHVVGEAHGCCHECCGGAHEGRIPAEDSHDCGTCPLCRIAFSPPLPVVLPVPAFVFAAVPFSLRPAPEAAHGEPQRRLAPPRGPPVTARA